MSAADCKALFKELAKRGIVNNVANSEDDTLRLLAASGLSVKQFAQQLGVQLHSKVSAGNEHVAMAGQLHFAIGGTVKIDKVGNISQELENLSQCCNGSVRNIGAQVASSACIEHLI
jgi:hypothetical protein